MRNLPAHLHASREQGQGVSLPELLELLEPDVDELLDELAARDSAPGPDAAPRPLRARAERNRKLSERWRGWVRPVPPPAELDEVALARFKLGQREHWAQQNRYLTCSHKFEACADGIERCRCGVWRMA